MKERNEPNMVIQAGVQGVIDYFRKKTGWGEMTRQGFQQKKN